ncbi:hypothetical protein Pmani_028559 [Petrolisthes manimaculis]|uniref:Uncharacterized protein n=1 Tax=Petrolisthes manimaculis TaxID=1843537 RepID=A0AAE1P1B4_9EUCA|nr:hypothetical protein Pmani_028559 [Petrolisthes manimaculis]
MVVVVREAADGMVVVAISEFCSLGLRQGNSTNTTLHYDSARKLATGRKKLRHTNRSNCLQRKQLLLNPKHIPQARQLCGTSGGGVVSRNEFVRGEKKKARQATLLTFPWLDLLARRIVDTVLFYTNNMVRGMVLLEEEEEEVEEEEEEVEEEEEEEEEEREEEELEGGKVSVPTTSPLLRPPPPPSQASILWLDVSLQYPLTHRLTSLRHSRGDFDNTRSAGSELNPHDETRRLAEGRPGGKSLRMDLHFKGDWPGLAS